MTEMTDRRVPGFKRRELMTGALQVLGLSAACAAGLGLAARSQTATAAWAPRPPGAVKNFTEACMKCGLCVKVCPKGALKLSRLGDPAPLGTPYFEPRKEACIMCEDLRCIKACTSGALDPKTDDIYKTKMGVAVIDPHSCLSWQGLRCEVCYRQCPKKGKALVLAPHPRGMSKHAVFVPQIDPDECTGCGLCEWSCPTEKAAVRIVNPDSVLGAIGEHYRLGWKDTEHQPHHPQAVRPEDQTAPDATPAGGLDFLNSEEPL